MRYSQIHPKTRREDPKDAPSPGTRLLIRAGFILQLAAGIWVWTHMGLMARRRMERIVREGMIRFGAIEVELPILQPKELWDETNRWDKYKAANISFRLRDRKNMEYILAPTAEEVITHYARASLDSHKDCGVTLWQMSPKFRDELRPRQGIIRGREFLMKDAYSFDSTRDAMLGSFQNMAEAYRWIFQRAGFKYIQVEADSGAIGGEGSAEFMAITEYGEDVLINCPACGYGANREKASAHFQYPETPQVALQKIPTPNIRTVAELEQALGFRPDQMVKTIVLFADGRPVVVSMRGDLEIHEIKLANLLGASEVGTADARTVEAVTGAPVGFAGPIGLYGTKKEFEGQEIRYYFDISVQGLNNFLCGGNEEDVHYINVNTGRDFPAPEAYHDLCTVRAGLNCPRCKAGVLRETQGVELGHIFQLQQVYSKPMNATFRTADMVSREAFWMGCYGIGVSRMVQAIVEQCYDENGIVWPLQAAPYQMVIVPSGSDMLAAATDIYEKLSDTGLDIMLDDRGVRFGEAIKDAELIGYPVIVIVGKSWQKEGLMEVRMRDKQVEQPGKMDLAQFRAWLENSVTPRMRQ